MFRSCASLLVIAFAAACSAESRAPRAPRAADDAASVARDTAVRVTDDGGRPVALAGPARRIVSLIPSVTETIIALGATDRLVGRTRYDVAPELKDVPSVGGGLDPSVEAIVALRPDVVLAWENDKRRATAHKLTALGIPVLSLRTEDTTDIFRGLRTLGRLMARDSAAAALDARLHAQFDSVRLSVAGRPRPNVLYVVFPDPPMTAGPATFIGQLIGLAGGRSVFDDQTALWPNVSMEEIVRRAPDVIVLPVGEFRASAAATLAGRPGWRDLRAAREGRVVAVPANLLSRPGAHIGDALRALRDAIHPEVAAARAADSTRGR